MKEQLMWCYLIHLSTHMWADDATPPNITHGTWYIRPAFQENNNVDLEVWDSTVKFVAERQYNTLLIDLGDGVKYESHPEISAPDAWDKDFLKKKLDEIRALGMTPIPKLNFSCGHMTWLKQYNRMVSSPIYYKVCADLIKEVCELFDNPPLFHLGFDEETVECQQEVEKAVVRGEKLWWHDLFFLAGECEKYGARPWIWSDYYWSFPELFKKNMPKSILQSNWTYWSFRDYKDGFRANYQIATYGELDDLGYDQVLTGSTWHVDENLYQTVAHGKNRIRPELLKGFMAAPWEMTTKVNRYTLMDDAERMYLARCELYPETLKF